MLAGLLTRLTVSCDSVLCAVLRVVLQQQVLVRAAGDRESGEQHIIWVNHPIRINPSPLASPRHADQHQPPTIW